MEWTAEIPTKEGQYWFIGDPFDKDENSEYKNELNYISVRKIAVGLAFVARGNFMENRKGLWRPVDFPELPFDGIIIK